ncbi:MAG: peptidoglycan DD-metalloendopeptidase family protein, partial [Oscillospiraceae bacterium]
EDDIKYDTVKVENSSAYKGTEKTLVKGEDGEALVTAEVTIVNGYEVGRNILRQDVIKQPVAEKISVGTMILSPAKGKVVSGSGSYGWPVAGGHITSGFGDGRGHKGVDIVAPKGTGIYAAESGTVILSQWYYGYGYCIKIQHSDGNVTLYGHQSKLIAKVGQQVDRGELIGLVGNTGDSDGNHCHFEIMRNGSYMNPSKFIGG